MGTFRRSQKGPRPTPWPSSKVKRPFLLFDLLAALALVSLLLIPLMRPHYLLLHQELRQLRTLQLELASHRAFTKVQELLYEGHFSWRSLNGKGDPPHGNLPNPESIRLLGGGEELLQASFRIFTPEGTWTKGGASYQRQYRLLEIEILLSHQDEIHHRAQYHLLIERNKPAAYERLHHG